MYPLASRLVLRFSWALMFIWFGTQQLLHPTDWIIYLPEWIGYLPIPPEMLMRLNGWTELVLAFALIIGCYTRFVAVMLSVHLAGIALSVGGATGIRDYALAAAGFALALDKPDAWTLDIYFAKKH